VRVFIADDHGGYRATMARQIAAHPQLELAGEAAAGAAALAAIVEHQPDVALIDVHMPGLNGIEVCQRLQADRSAPRTRVVLISVDRNRALATEALQAGAVALLGKETPPDRMCAQLLAAGAGRVGWSVE
jgi:DNA-binding NarL/FixJ family response regulator